MANQYKYDVLATPLSPLVVRDGRPFGEGGTMKSLPWIYPSTFSGSLRTVIGKETDLDLESLKRIETTGALPYLPDKDDSKGVLYLPKPFDCVVCEKVTDGNKKRKVYAVRPEKLENDEGCDLPYDDKLKPAMLQKNEGEDNFKPTKTAPFWSWEKFVEWLGRENVQTDKQGKIEQGIVVDDTNCPQLLENPGKHALKAFPKDERTCVAINSQRGVATVGRLFSTVGLDLFQKESGRSLALFSRVTTEQKDLFSTLGALGGRRRLASWNFTQPRNLDAPDELKRKAQENKDGKNKRVRMVLVTPAIFENGWLPDWLEPQKLEGVFRVCDKEVKLKLKSVAIDRWFPVSGWSYETRGPKKVRRMVPAGGVYFFEVVSGKVDVLFNEAWFRSVCNEQDARDGFGVALWGFY